MYELHGWITLRYHAHDTELKLQEEAVEAFINYITSTGVEKDTYLISRRNGLDTFMISRLHNHKFERVLDVYKWVAVNLPGSYGLLYIHDDENFYGSNMAAYDHKDPSVDNSNKFIVWKIAKGKLTIEEDPFLSPCVPVIEDEYDPTRDD